MQRSCKQQTEDKVSKINMYVDGTHVLVHTHLPQVLVHIYYPMAMNLYKPHTCMHKQAYFYGGFLYCDFGMLE